MIFKDVVGFEGLYKVSDTGEVLSVVRKNGFGSRSETRVRKIQFKKGYPSIALSKNHKLHWMSVHSIVATAFIPNPNNLPVINHINGNKMDNRVENLEWCDQSWNETHAHAIGLKGGEKSGVNKITALDARAIRRLYPNVSVIELAKAFELSRGTVHNILKNKTWKKA